MTAKTEAATVRARRGRPKMYASTHDGRGSVARNLRWCSSRRSACMPDCQPGRTDEVTAAEPGQWPTLSAMHPGTVPITSAMPHPDPLGTARSHESYPLFALVKRVTEWSLDLEQPFLPAMLPNIVGCCEFEPEAMSANSSQQHRETTR